ncbi:MAG: hypothetical protein QM767_07880 [Anaeromyxobacter sp.]
MSWRAHRPYALLGLLCAALAAVPVIMARTVPDPMALAGSYMGWTLGLYLAAFTGAALAAATFGADDAQRPGWLLMGLSYLALLPARLLVGPNPSGLFQADEPLLWLRVVSSVANSSLMLAAMLALARAWRQSGLDDPRPWLRWVTQLAGVALAVALMGPDLIRTQLPAVLDGDAAAWGNVITDVLDGLVLAVAVPVLRAAVALGGGLVAWPWLFLTTGLLGWICFDAIAASDGLGLTPFDARTATEVARTWACLFTMAAGAAQRWIMSAPPGAPDEDAV